MKTLFIFIFERIKEEDRLNADVYISLIVTVGTSEDKGILLLTFL